MKTIWSREALADLKRTIEFLEVVNSQAAHNALELIESGVKQLIQFPQCGEAIERFLPRNVRRLIVDNYEIHYEASEAMVTILRVWHQREDRPILTQ